MRYVRLSVSLHARTDIRLAVVSDNQLKELRKLVNGFRFQPAAILYSLPRALVHWSILLLGVEVLSLLLEVSTEWATIIMAALISLAAGAVLVTFMVRRGTRAWHTYRSQNAIQSQA